MQKCNVITTTSKDVGVIHHTEIVALGCSVILLHFFLHKKSSIHTLSRSIADRIDDLVLFRIHSAIFVCRTGLFGRCVLGVSLLML